MDVKGRFSNFIFGSMRSIFYVLICAFCWSSCSKDPVVWKIRNLNNDQISVFGHGGMGISSLYPINSLPSIRESIDVGADGTEMDIQMSNDSVLFLFHSNRLEDQTSCSGSLHEKTAEEIECEYRSLVHNNIKIIKLTTLFEQLTFPEHFIFTFECKLKLPQDPVFEATFAKTLTRFIVSKNLTERCFVESSHESFLILLHSQNKDLKCFLYTNNFEVGMESAERLGLYGLIMDMFSITKSQVESAHKKNVRVTVFNQ